MTDLIERARKYNKEYELIHELADEVERLRRTIIAVRDALDSGDTHYTLEQISKAITRSGIIS